MYAVSLETILPFGSQIVCRFFDNFDQAKAYSQMRSNSKIIEIQNDEEITIVADDKGDIELLTHTEIESEGCSVL